MKTIVTLTCPYRHGRRHLMHVRPVAHTGARPGVYSGEAADADVSRPDTSPVHSRSTSGAGALAGRAWRVGADGGCGVGPCGHTAGAPPPPRWRCGWPQRRMRPCSNGWLRSMRSRRSGQVRHWSPRLTARSGQRLSSDRVATIADPFVPSQDAVELLRLRAEQIGHAARPRGVSSRHPESDRASATVGA